MAWLAVAMPVHWQQVMLRSSLDALVQRGALRALGWLQLALSLLACLRADHPSMAVLVWIMLLAGSALLVAFLLAWRPRVLRLLCPVY